MESWSGHELLEASRLAFSYINEKSDELNRLNIFPVPDGDTGLNMSRSLAPILSLEETPSIGEAAQRISQAVLASSRGNSGTILATFFLGFAEELVGKESADSAQLVKAFTQGASESYLSLPDPAEGTILTVMKDVGHITPLPSIARTFDAMEKAAQISLQNTPNLMPLLKKSGLIDAGGLGFYYLVKAFEDAANGKKDGKAFPSVYEKEIDEEKKKEASDDLAYRFCIEGLLKKSEPYRGVKKAEFLKEQLSSLGASLVFVETASLVKFHVHANDETPIVSAVKRFGTLLDYKVDNMLEQVHNEEHKDEVCGFVPVIDGASFAAIYDNFEVASCPLIPLGHDVSYEELSEAVKSLKNDVVVLLPNNPNSFSTCELLIQRSSRAIVYLATHDEAEGVVALGHYDPSANVETNLREMNAALKKSDFYQIAQAEHDFAGPNLTIRQGDFILIKGSEFLAAKKNVVDLYEILKNLLANKKEITIYTGVSAPEEEASFLRDRLSEDLLDVSDVILVNGGQKVYRYLVSAEEN